MSGVGTQAMVWSGLPPAPRPAASLPRKTRAGEPYSSAAHDTLHSDVVSYHADVVSHLVRQQGMAALREAVPALPGADADGRPRGLVRMRAPAATAHALSA